MRSGTSAGAGPAGPSAVASPPARVRWLAWLAGLADTATGCGLILAPEPVLRLLGVPPVAEPVFLRWIGAFVLAVGLAYLYPWLLPRRWRAARLRVVLEVTALARGAVFVVAGAAIAAGALAPQWLGVPLFDGVLAAAQLLQLRGWPRVEPGRED